jgi:uncharacterized coiled-coil protein SlyX
MAMSDDDRTTELEIKVAFLEKNFADLSGVVHLLSNQVDVLLEAAKRVQILENRLVGEAPDADDKPPHF